MRIRGWQVDGFGIFRDYRVSDLPGGLVLVYGPNEAGKSTLLAFLRGVLFGFADRRSNEPQYPPLGGGQHGGALLLENADGVYRVERLRARKSILTITRPDGSEGGDDDLQRLLGSADRQLFKSVFAFSLQELAAMETLSSEEVRAHIFSAGIAGAGRSAREVIDQLQAEAGSLLGARSAGRIRELVKEGQALGEQIDLAVRRAMDYSDALRCEEEAARLVTRLEREWREADLRARRAAVLADAWPTESARQQAVASLAALPAIDAFPPDADARLAAALGDVRATAEACARAERALAQLHGERRTIRLDDRLPGVASAAAHLVAEGEVQRNRLARIAELQDEHGGAEPTAADVLDRQQRAMQRLRPGLAELAQLDADRRVEERVRADARDEQEAAGQPGRWLTWAPYALAAIGVVFATFAAWRLVASDRAAGVVLAIACLLSAALAEALRRLARGIRATGNGGARRLQRGDEAARRLDELERRAAEIRTALAEDAACLGLPALPTAAGLEDRQATWSAQRDACRKRDEARTLLAAVRDWEQRAGEVLDAAGVATPQGRHERWIDAARDLAQRCASDAAARHEASRLDAAIASATPEVDAARRARDASLQALGSLLAEAGVAGEEEFRERLAHYRGRQRLAQQIAELETRLVALLGRGEDVPETRRELAAGRVSQWREERSQAEGEVERLRGQHEAAIRGHQDLVNARRRLEEAADVAQLELQRQAVREELEVAVRRYRVTALAATLVSETLREFERTRQPAVLANASETFERVTDGRYPRILQTEGGEGIVVLDRQGARRAVGELSRGTQEQLYLSMRLGLAREFGQRDVPLPLVMDDVLVNFDQARARRMATELIGFARTQQVLLFTCHEFVRSMLVDLDPRVCVIDLQVPPMAGGEAAAP